MSALRLVATLLVLAVGIAHAAPLAAQGEPGPAIADEADVEFQLGNAAYVSGDYEEALGHYFASYRLVPNRNVLFNVARCYENLDRPVEAHRYYSQYLEGLEGKERADVEKALERIGRKVGTLKITSEPAGASVYLDRKNLGEYAKTPAEVVVKPGTYDVIVEREGWLPQIVKGVKITAGGSATHTVSLARREGNVLMRGEPPNATVRVLPDGAPQQPDENGAVALPLGAQRVEVTADGFMPAIVELTVGQAQTPVLEYALMPQLGQIAVQATEPGAAVYLDDKLIGFVPELADAPAGEHVLVIRAEGYQPYERTVVVRPGEQISVNAELTLADEVAAASKVTESVRDAPASVSVISSREIDAFRYRGTADALEGTRGIHFTNDLTYHTVGIRGYLPFSQFGNRTLVLIDGHKVNDSWIEASFHEAELTSELFGYDRLELVRGPTSVLHGSGAFQGVISLASPDVGDAFQPSKVGLQAAEDGVYKAYGHVRETFDGGGVQVSAATVQGQPRDFISPDRTSSDDTTPLVARDVGGAEAYTTRLNAKWRDFELYSFFHTRDKQSPTGGYGTIFGDSRTFERDTRGFVDVRHNLALGAKTSLRNRVYLDTYGFEGNFAYEDSEGGLFRDRFSGLWTGVESRLTMEPFDRLRWTTSVEGARHLRHRARSEDDDGPIVSVDAPFWQTALSTTVRLDLTRWVSVWAGARYDLWFYDSLPAADGGTDEGVVIQNANPRLVGLFRPAEGSTVKVIGSRGFRAPSVYELSYNDGGQTQVANPELTPESIWSAEVEYIQKLVYEFDGVVGVFAQQTRNPIEAVGAGTSADPLRYENRDDQLWSAGVDLEVRRPFFRGWMASAMISYQRTRPGGFTTVFDSGTNIPNSPRATGSLKLATPLVSRQLMLANRVVYQAGRLDRLRELTNPSVNWDLVLSGRVEVVPVKWSLGVRNLLDWDIEHPVGDEFFDVRLPQPGRTITADVAVTW